MRTLHLILFSAFCLTTSLAAQPTVSQVIVANQGNFSDANGSITLYDPGTGTTVQDVASDIGSIIQSVGIFENRLYIMSNTGAGIDIVDLNTRERVGQIAGITGSRYMDGSSGKTLYITSQSFTSPGFLTVVQEDAIVQTIEVGGAPEGVAVVGNRAYVAKGGFGTDSTLAVIDTATYTLLETLDVGCGGPRSLAVDAEEELWVFCTGADRYDENFNLIGQTNGQVVILNGPTGAEVDRLSFPYQLGDASKVGQDVFFASDAEEVYVLAAGQDQILRFDTRTNTLSDSLQINSADTPSALAYDGTHEHLYIGHTTGFTTAGYVTFHDRTGAEVGRFDAGVAPVFIAPQTATETATERIEGNIPNGFDLAAHYPNPLRTGTETTFQFTLPEPTNVTLRIYSVLGQEIATLVEEALPAGTYQTTWKAGRVTGGTYFYRLETGGYAQTRTMTITP